MIDKYVGDEVMALFGTIKPLAHSSFQAIDMVDEIKKWNIEAEGLPEIEMGMEFTPVFVVAGNMDLWSS